VCAPAVRKEDALRPSLGARRPGACVALLLAVAVSMLTAAPAGAQEPVKSFDLLNTRLKPGDTVWVTDAQGREIRGKVIGLSPASLQLEAGGATRELAAEGVGVIKAQPKDSLRNGVLLGALIGFAGGAVSCAANPQCIDDEGGPGVTVGLALVGAAAGAGIGAAVDAAVKGPKLVVYRAKGVTIAFAF
jgi:hypothetical protein